MCHKKDRRESSILRKECAVVWSIPDDCPDSESVMVLNISAFHSRTTPIRFTFQKGILIKARVLHQVIAFLLHISSSVFTLNDDLFKTHFEQDKRVHRHLHGNALNYSWKQIPVRGCFSATTSFKDWSGSILFCIVRVGTNLLGIDAIQQLDLITGAQLKCFHITTKPDFSSKQKMADEPKSCQSTDNGNENKRDQ